MRDRFETYVDVDPNGVAKTFGRQEMEAFFKRHPSTRFTVSISKKRNKIQNSYYWVVLNFISDYMGGFDKMDAYKLHEIFKFKFLQEDFVDESTGEVFTMVKSTTELSKKEFAEYVDKIIIYVADTLHIVVPPPGDQLETGI